LAKIRTHTVELLVGMLRAVTVVHGTLWYQSYSAEPCVGPMATLQLFAVGALKFNVRSKPPVSVLPAAGEIKAAATGVMDAVALGLGDGDGLGDGVTLGEGVALGLGDGLGDGVLLGVTAGVTLGEGDGEGVGLGVTQT
jgi:hypothetical protein